MHKTYFKKVVFFFASIGFFMSFTFSASALSFSIYYYSDISPNSWETCSGSIGLDKSSYPTGSTVNIGGTLTSTNVDWNSTCDLSLNNPSSYYYHKQVPLGQKSSSVSLAASPMLTELGMNSIGSHNLEFLMKVTDTQGLTRTPLTSPYIYLSFAVDSPAPTVNLFFSFIDKVKDLFSSFAVNVASLISTTAYANTQPGSAHPQATILADVNIVDVLPTSGTSSPFFGKFTLQGKMGQQNDILYGVTLLDEKGTIIDSKNLGKVDSIHENEMKKLSYEYSIPGTISGPVTLLLSAETVAGFPLSVYTLYKDNIAGVKKSFPCSYTPATKNSIEKIECLSMNNSTLLVEYRKGSVYNVPSSKENISLEASKKFTLKPTVALGRYFITITDQGSKEARTLPYSVEGDYGTILTVNINDGETPGTLKTVVYTDVSVPSKVSVNLVDKKGKVCGQGIGMTLGRVVEIPIMSKCTEGTVSIVLESKDGAMLDTASQPFQSTPFIKVASVNDKKIEVGTLKPRNMISVGVVAVLVFAGVIILKRRKDNLQRAMK